MKFLLFSLIALMGCNTNAQKYFPKYEEVIDPEFPKSQNIYPIATLDLSEKGIKEKIHVTYVYFDYNSTGSDFLRKGENPSNYSFQLLDNGLMRPLFTANSLKIGEGDLKYFTESRKTFDGTKQILKLASYIYFPKNPQWWQNDETPINEMGKKLTFICQIDMYDISKSDCRMFIFYDKENRIIKNICQWD